MCIRDSRKHPMLALERIATLCASQLIVETLITEEPKNFVSQLYSAITVYKAPNSWVEFYEEDKINQDWGVQIGFEPWTSFWNSSWQSRFFDVRWPRIFKGSKVILGPQRRPISIFTTH